jgi:hypothetical protein
MDQQLPRNTAKRLNLLGVCRSSKHPTHKVFTAHCWYQLISLQKRPLPEGQGGIGNVIFEINDREKLRTVVEEILRLGNDRMALLCYSPAISDEFLAFLHVNHPPYYTLLRALESDVVSQQKSLYAYYEQAPRCWVEFGWYYPLAHSITVPENRRLFMRSPRLWRFFDDAPFQNIYQALDIQIPSESCLWQAQDQVPKISIPLRLTVDPRRVEPSLWLIPEGGQLDFEEWLRGTNEKILERLSFAVAESPDQEKWIVLYAETGGDTLTPPVLDLEIALPYVPHPLVHNIYLPKGYTLHPQLRSETLQRLFLTDYNQIVWIYPIDNQTFRPYILSLNAFKRMTEWISYLISQHRVVLKEWIDATTFDWTLNIREIIDTDDRGIPPSSLTEVSASSERSGSQSGNVRERKETPNQATQGQQRSLRKGKRNAVTEIPQGGSTSQEKSSPSETSLRDLEQRFLQISGNRLDDPQRLQLWPKLAQAYSDSNRLDQAALCWLHALWHCEPEEMLPLIKQWFEAEWKGLTTPSLKRWKQMLEDRLVSEMTIQRQLVSFIYWILRYPDYCTVDFLQEFHQFLEKNQELLPLRGLWIGYGILSRRLDNPLLLHRVADRLLESLMHNPSVSLRDLPRFLHGGSLQYQVTLQTLRERLSELLGDVLQWVNLSTSGNATKQQEPYVYYLFAYLAARLDITKYTDEWLKQAELSMSRVFSSESDSKINNLYISIVDRAYKHRIYEVVNKLSRSPQLPNDIHKDIEKLSVECKRYNDGLAYYSIIRLLQKSELLEPFLQKDAIPIWLEKYHNTSNYDMSNNISTKLYLQLLRRTLAQMLSKKLSEMSKLWLEFTDKLQQLFDIFPPNSELYDSEKGWNRQSIGELGRVYSNAFQVAGMYGQQRWIEHLGGMLDRHIQLLSSIGKEGVSFDIILMSELVPVAVFVERSCHNSGLLNYINQKLSPWRNLSSQTLQNQVSIDEIICAHISSIVVNIVSEKKYNQKEILERLHQQIMKFRPLDYNQRIYVKIVTNYIKCISCLSNISSVEYIHKYFKDCIDKGISISNTWSSHEYVSLDHLQIIESLVHVLETLLIADSGDLSEKIDLKTDLQVENEYLFRRRLINDINIDIYKNYK